MFGLDVDTLRDIRKVIAGFPCIEKVLIYGSRARGNYKVGSDIDLTLVGKDLTYSNSINPLMSRLDDLSLPYTFDISIFNKLGDPDLIEHVLRVGKTFYRGADSAKWPVVELGEVCEINPRKSEVIDVDEASVVSFIPVEDMNENQMYFDVKKSVPLKHVCKGYNHFGENDVLLAKVTPCSENRKAGIARGLHNKIGFASSEFFVLRSSEKILPEWIYLNILTPNFMSNGDDSFTGTSGLRRISEEFVRSYRIPLPHPHTQKEIVIVLNNAFQVVDKAIQNVGENQKNYQDFFDSYLQRSISGKRPVLELREISEVNPEKSEVREVEEASIMHSLDILNEKSSTITSLVGQKLANLRNLKESILQQALNGELTGNNK